MAFYITRDLMWCRTFSLSLKAEALARFNFLSPKFINNFATTCSLFDIQFTTIMSHHLKTLALVNLKQENEKSLCSFMD